MSDIKTFRYLDEIWSNITPLNADQTVWLSINSIDHRAAVKKYVPKEKVQLFEKLTGCNNRHLEKIIYAASGTDRGLIIAEYISGATLNEVLQSRGFLSELEAKSIFNDIMCGVDELHRFGIIHRDIKPENVIISSDGIVKVIDFGISREKAEEKKADTTILGTIGYAAPEQFGFSQTDERTDIYALGVLLNVILTGHIPKDGIYDDRKYSKIIKKCTEIKPGERYSSVMELEAAVNGYFYKNDNIRQHQNSAGNRNTKSGKNPLWWLPGFRSLKWWKMTLSVLIYVIMGFWTVVCFEDVGGDFIHVLISSFLIFFHAIAVPLLVGNVAYWDDYVPIFQRWSHRERVAMRITWGILLWIIGFALYLSSVGRITV